MLVATDARVLLVDTRRGTMTPARGLDDRPTCLALDPHTEGRAWCGTRATGVFRSDDGGATWRPAGLEGRAIMAVAASPTEPGVVWAGTEPSQVWRLEDPDGAWRRMRALETLPSSSDWSFPPRPETHHVRWIACHPATPGRLWVAVEAGALVATTDGGRGWRDRVTGGPFDTHELAIHPAAPDTLRVAAGDGYYESDDAGATWRSPSHGLEVHYLRSVAIDPGDPATILVSASSSPRRAYVAGHADGRVYRRVAPGSGAEAGAEAGGAWSRVRDGWPEPPSTIAPLLRAGRVAGEFWAADERGVHNSRDGGATWALAAGFPRTPDHLRGLVVGAT